MIAHALATRGEAALHWLEGDFAFAAQHGPSSRVLAARDFGGHQALFYAATTDALWVGTDVDTLLERAALPRTLDLAALATAAAGLWGHDPATAYAAVREVPAGHVLTWRPDQQPQCAPFWRVPDRIAVRRAPLDDAAMELRGLLEAAIAERVPEGSVAAVSLSGGWDSTAVYGTAKAIGRDLHAVSISYPSGDPGREDELIAQTTEFWKARPDFIDIADVPLFDDWTGQARARALPFAHAYEQWNRALHRRARAAGATVMLDGVGGDQLFQASDRYLSDLARTFQWGELLRQARIRRGGRLDWRFLVQQAALPALPDAVVAGIFRFVRRHPPGDYLERLPPGWFRRDFLLRHRILDREREARPRIDRRRAVLGESQAYLTFAFYPRVFGLLTGFAREEGVALRSPLLDERIVRFAVQRPWSDRVDGAETKLLLRRAMRGRLPDELLAPRSHRTGTTNAYFLRELRGAGWAVAEPLLDDLRLADIGMIEPSHYRRAWQHLLGHDDDELAVRLFFTLQAELWLRTHSF
ncbi:MAG: hypothetical protein KF709_05990 [Gemmatimonadaceae bacterium]|nr:hypothetical protein [Gemmatimonadaceae bacterium]